jgi:hypothetical protein
MDQPPTGPMPTGRPFAPPSGPPMPPDLAATEVDSTAPDRTGRQPTSGTRRRGRRLVPRIMTEEAFQALRGHLAAVGLALLIATPFAFAVFFGLGSLRFALDDRTLWNSVAHSIVQFWYVLLAFVVVAFPPALVAVRRGGREAVSFVADRGYWRAMLIAYVVIPAVAALVAFIVGHVLIVLVILLVLFVILVHSGGF